MNGVTSVLSAVVDVWALRPPEVLALTTRSAAPIAIGVALLAGLSTAVGHAVIYAINRVKGVRMIVCISLMAVYTTLLRVALAATIAAVGWALTQGRVDGATIALVYLLSLAPHVLQVLVFIPHLGLGIGRLLEGWSVLALVVMLAHVLAIGWWWALLLSGGIWLATQLISHLLARPLARTTSRLWRLATGHATYLTAHDVLAGAPFVPLERRERPA